jgi:membrane-bound metal-dependent hydrolase YbcI (DUF457 family)
MMFKAYRHPWFVLYSGTVLSSIFAVLPFGVGTLLLGAFSIFLVDSGYWPCSKKWSVRSIKFHKRNRLLVGGSFLIISVSYFVFGTEYWLVSILLVGFLLFYIERLVVDSASAT